MLEPLTSKRRSKTMVRGIPSVVDGPASFPARSDTDTTCTVTSWPYDTAWAATELSPCPLTGMTAVNALPVPNLVVGSMSMWSTT